MSRRWGVRLERDPAYSPWLALEREDMSRADRPRVSLLEPWFLTVPMLGLPAAEDRARTPTPARRSVEAETA